MAWVTPKTDWKSTDYFNFEDANKIYANIIAVRQIMIQKGIPAAEIPISGYSVSSLTTIPYSNTWQALEDNIKVLTRRHTPIGYKDRDLPWSAESSISFSDINRWENNLKLIYEYYLR